MASSASVASATSLASLASAASTPLSQPEARHRSGRARAHHEASIGEVARPASAHGAGQHVATVDTSRAQADGIDGSSGARAAHLARPQASLSRSGVCVNSNAKIAKGADEGGYEADCAWLLPHTRPMRYQPNQPFIYESNKHY